MNEHEDGVGTRSSEAPELIGSWSFPGPSVTQAEDESGQGRALVGAGAALWTSAGPLGGGAVLLDGATASLATREAVIATKYSFSVTAWVRLDSSLIGPDLDLPVGWYAATAVSQEGPTVRVPSHCAFYLGARLLAGNTPDGTPTEALHWCFNVAPLDGSVEQKDFEWEKAFSSRSVGREGADRWTLLVGVFDIDARRTHLYVRSDQGNDEGGATLPWRWPYWQADGPFLVGRARWLGNPVDHWPGAIGPIRVYSGILTADDATALFSGDTVAGA
jgi:hypothetical protein